MDKLDMIKLSVDIEENYPFLYIALIIIKVLLIFSTIFFFIGLFALII